MLCYSTGSLPDLPLDKVLDLYPQNIFPGVELVITPKMLERYNDHPYWEDIATYIKEKKLFLRSIHLGHPHLGSGTAHFPGLAATAKSESKDKLEIVLKCVEIANRLLPNKFTITTGLRVEDDIPMSAMMNLYVGIDKILKKLNPAIKLTLEQEPEHVIHSTPQMLELCQRYEGELFLTFDVGHSQVLGEDIPQSLKALFPYLLNIHFEDIKNRVHQHLLFGDGDINFEDIFLALTEIGYGGDLTPDLYPFANQYQEAFRASETFFRKHNILK